LPVYPASQSNQIEAGAADADIESDCTSVVIR